MANRRNRATEVLMRMRPEALRRLALAVFLMFGILGPLTILMESQIRIVPWSFVVIQTIVSGGFAASILLAAKRRWWVMVVTIIFWTGVMGLNSGGLSFQFDDKGKFRVNLSGFSTPDTRPAPAEQLTLTSSELDAIYVQRGSIGLIAICLLAAGYVMFIRVIRGELKQRERIEAEVSIAREIQKSLLPSTTLVTTWCSIGGRTIPATEVGGDYFDVVPLADGRVAVAIADVTGHGVGAGILSAMTKSAFHSQLANDPAPVRLLENLNATISSITDERVFVTFGYVLLDPSGRSAQFATAGHPPLLFCKKATGAVQRLRTVSLGLGIQSSARYTQESLDPEKGDSILLYTDGVIEASNGAGEQFGIDRLVDALSQCTAPKEKVCDELISAISGFSGKAIFEDDISLVLISMQ